MPGFQKTMTTELLVEHLKKNENIVCKNLVDGLFFFSITGSDFLEDDFVSNFLAVASRKYPLPLQVSEQLRAAHRRALEGAATAEEEAAAAAAATAAKKKIDFERNADNDASSSSPFSSGMDVVVHEGQTSLEKKHAEAAATTPKIVAKMNTEQLIAHLRILINKHFEEKSGNNSINNNNIIINNKNDDGSAPRCSENMFDFFRFFEVDGATFFEAANFIDDNFTPLMARKYKMTADEVKALKEVHFAIRNPPRRSVAEFSSEELVALLRKENEEGRQNNAEQRPPVAPADNAWLAGIIEYITSFEITGADFLASDFCPLPNPVLKKFNVTRLAQENLAALHSRVVNEEKRAAIVTALLAAAPISAPAKTPTTTTITTTTTMMPPVATMPPVVVDARKYLPQLPILPTLPQPSPHQSFPQHQPQQQHHVLQQRHLPQHPVGAVAGQFARTNTEQLHHHHHPHHLVYRLRFTNINPHFNEDYFAGILAHQALNGDPAPLIQLALTYTHSSKVLPKINPQNYFPTLRVDVLGEGAKQRLLALNDQFLGSLDALRVVVEECDYARDYYLAVPLQDVRCIRCQQAGHIANSCQTPDDPVTAVGRRVATWKRSQPVTPHCAVLIRNGLPHATEEIPPGEVLRLRELIDQKMGHRPAAPLLPAGGSNDPKRDTDNMNITYACVGCGGIMVFFAKAQDCRRFMRDFQGSDLFDNGRSATLMTVPMLQDRHKERRELAERLAAGQSNNTASSGGGGGALQQAGQRRDRDEYPSNASLLLQPQLQADPYAPTPYPHQQRQQLPPFQPRQQQMPPPAQYRQLPHQHHQQPAWQQHDPLGVLEDALGQVEQDDPYFRL